MKGLRGSLMGGIDGEKHDAVLMCHFSWKSVTLQDIDPCRDDLFDNNGCFGAVASAVGERRTL